MADSEGEDIDDFEVADWDLESDVQELFNRQKGFRYSKQELRCIVDQRMTEIFEQQQRT